MVIYHTTKTMAGSMESWNLTTHLELSHQPTFLLSGCKIASVLMQPKHFLDKGPHGDLTLGRTRIMLDSANILLGPLQLSNFGKLLSPSRRGPIWLQSLPFKDLDTEGSVLFSGHLPGMGGQVSWGRLG